MHRVIYDFDIKSDCAPEFESVVADWFQVMKARPGFIAISLFHSVGKEEHYCAISDWASEQAYEVFHASSEHQRVADATARLFTTQKRAAFNLIYQVTMRECED